MSAPPTCPLAHPDKPLPHEFASPKDYRPALRPANTPAVTHAAVLRARARAVRRRLCDDGGPAVVVLPEDATELDFSGRATRALPPIGNGGGRGYERRNALAVGPRSREISGLVDPTRHQRRRVPEGVGTELLRPQSRAGPEPLIALLSVVAVPLVNSRVAARQGGQGRRPARELVDPLWVKVLSTWRNQEERELTERQFTPARARLGGHQNRGRDGLPGWQTLWRGGERLRTMLDYELSRQTCGKH